MVLHELRFLSFAGGGVIIRFTPYDYSLNDVPQRMRRSMGRYPSGQRGQTVNLLPSASKVRILASPPNGTSSIGSASGGRDGGIRVVGTRSKKRGRSSGVELQPSKLAVASSNLVARSKPNLFDPERFEFARRDKATRASPGAHVAQLAEHVLGKDEVTRSIRVVGSTLHPPTPGLPGHALFPGLFDPELLIFSTG